MTMQKRGARRGAESDGRGAGKGTGATRTAPQLATPTDLTDEAVEQIAAAVNPIIADHFALYIKTKNFHWHLSGSHFRDYHLLFDEQADDILASIDPLAERMRKIGAPTIRSVGQVGQLTRVEDDDEEFVPAGEMVRRLLADNQRSAAAMREAMELCEDQRDHPTSNLLQEIMDQTERRIWFLFEICQGEGNTE
jgi:starvation-inducible DNA-binding protein